MFRLLGKKINAFLRSIILLNRPYDFTLTAITAAMNSLRHNMWVKVTRHQMCLKSMLGHIFSSQVPMFSCDEPELIKDNKKAPKVKPVLSGHSKRGLQIGFQDGLSLKAGQKYCRMLQESILQYFRPSLSYHVSFRPRFCLFLSGRLRQVLLYSKTATSWTLVWHSTIRAHLESTYLTVQSNNI